MGLFKCQHCGRAFSCPTCRRRDKSASHAVKCMLRVRRAKKLNYCSRCKKTFGKAVASAMPKDARNYIMLSAVLPTEHHKNLQKKKSGYLFGNYIPDHTCDGDGVWDK